MIPAQLLTHKLEWIRKVGEYLQKNQANYIIYDIGPGYIVMGKCNNPTKPRYKSVVLYDSGLLGKYEIRFAGRELCTFNTIEQMLQTLHKMK